MELQPFEDLEPHSPYRLTGCRQTSDDNLLKLQASLLKMLQSQKGSHVNLLITFL
jgi:hypothetical protein